MIGLGLPSLCGRVAPFAGGFDLVSIASGGGWFSIRCAPWCQSVSTKKKEGNE